MAINQAQVDHIISTASADDPEVRMQRLQDDVDLIKKSIKKLLIDIRDRMNELENPFVLGSQIPGDHAQNARKESSGEKTESAPVKEPEPEPPAPAAQLPQPPSAHPPVQEPPAPALSMASLIFWPDPVTSGLRVTLPPTITMEAPEATASAAESASIPPATATGILTWPRIWS